jgi:hypothetical protein
MNPMLQKFMAQAGGLFGKAIPEMGAPIEKVAGWSKGAGKRESIKELLAKLAQRYEDAPELAKVVTAGGVSGLAGAGLGNALSDDDDYEVLLAKLEAAKRKQYERAD